jgi:hypothetical protein
MLNTAFPRNHIDTIDRAGLNTQVTARTFIDNNGMHLFGRTQDCIDRTCLNALCATNTLILPDKGNGGLGFDTVLCIQWLGLYVQQVGERLNGVFTTRRALVN